MKPDAFKHARELGIKTIRLAIYQPKVGGLTEWTCSLEDLERFAARARSAAASTINAEKDYGHVPNEDWERTYLNRDPNDKDCAFCRAMSVCPAVARKVQETVGASFGVIADDGEQKAAKPESMQPVDLSKAMAAAPLIEDWAAAVRAETERRLLAGTPVEGFGLELGRKGARKFADEAVAEEMVRKQFRLKVEDAYDLKLKSPTSFEKMTKPGPDGSAVIGKRQWTKLQALITQADPKVSVKPLAAIKNPYTVPALSADAFSTVTDGDDNLAD